MSDDEYQNTDDEFGDDDLVIDEDEDFSEDDYSEQVVDRSATMDRMQKQTIEILKTIKYKPTKYLQYISTNVIINPIFAYSFKPMGKIAISETLQTKDSIQKLSMKPLSLFPQKDIQNIISSSATTLTNVNVVLIREIPANIVVPSEQDINQFFQARQSS